MFRYLYLDICPPMLEAGIPQRWSVANVPVAHPLCPTAFDTSSNNRLPQWFASLPTRPNVYVTMGTIANHTPGLFEVVLEGLGEGPFNVIVTVGRDRDPAQLTPRPSNVYVERWLPQSAVLSRCHAVVCHGGWGTTLGALAHGLPLLIVPPYPNHYYNSVRCTSVGAGLSLPRAHLSPSTVYSAVCDLLRMPHFRINATRIRREIEQMPLPAQVVPVLERLAHDRRPIFGRLYEQTAPGGRRSKRGRPAAESL
jgi:MGT family glycosyltransferase